MRKTPEATQATVEVSRTALELGEKITEALKATIHGEQAQAGTLHWGDHGSAEHVRELLARTAAFLGIIDIDELESTGSIVYLPR